MAPEQREFVELCRELRALGASEVVAGPFRAVFQAPISQGSIQPAPQPTHAPTGPRVKQRPTKPTPLSEEERRQAERDARIAELTGGL